MKYSSAACLGFPLLACSLLIACDDTLLPVPELEYGPGEHWRQTSTYSGVGAGRLLVTNSIDDTASLFDLAKLGQPDFAELARIPVGLNPVELEGPHHGAVDPSGEYYYVNISNYVPGAGGGPHGPRGTGLANGYVLKYRTSNNELVAYQEVDRSPGDLTISADGKELYITHYDIRKIIDVALMGGPQSDMNTRFVILDAETMTEKAALTLCPAAHGVRISP